MDCKSKSLDGLVSWHGKRGDCQFFEHFSKPFGEQGHFNTKRISNLREFRNVALMFVFFFVCLFVVDQSICSN